MNFEVEFKTERATKPLTYENFKDEPVERRLARWFINGEVGSSSRSLAAWCLSIREKWHSHPHDADDRMRCVKLLELIPEWQRYLDGIPFEEWEEHRGLIKQELIERGSWIVE